MNLKNRFLELKEYSIKKYEEFKKSDKKEFIIKNKIIIIILLVGIVFGLGYTFGYSETSREALVKDLQINLIKGNSRKLDNIITINGEKVDKEKLKPLVEYYKDKEALVNNLINDVKEDKSNILKIKEEKNFLRDTYKAELSTFNLEINTEDKGEKIYLNNNEVEGNKKIEGLIPGTYDIKGVLKSDFGYLTKEKDVVLMKNESVDLDIDANYITIHSNFEDAKVYINGNDSGKTVKEFKKVGPFPTDGSIKVQVEKNLPWGLIKSEEVAIYNKPDINVDIDMKNDEAFIEVKKTVDSFYNSVFKALNEENKGVIDAATDETKDKVYRVLEKKYFFLKNEYNMTGLEIDKEKSTFSYKDGEYKASIVCDVNYDVSKALFGLGKESKNTKFFTKMIYKNNTWIVSDVENFSL